MGCALSARSVHTVYSLRPRMTFPHYIKSSAPPLGTESMREDRICNPPCCGRKEDRIAAVVLQNSAMTRIRGTPVMGTPAGAINDSSLPRISGPYV